MNYMHKIKIGKEIFFASDGEKLSEVLLRVGKTVSHPCGGRGVCKKCLVTVNGKQELSCLYRVTSDIEVILPANEDIVSETGNDFASGQTENICFVLDIGTTTLALACVSLDEQKPLSVVTRTNPQRAFGADVISRIAYCQQHSSQLMHDVLIKTVNEMISYFACKQQPTLYVAGNTTMLHLFFNIDCSSMGTAPYTPQFLGSKRMQSKEIGITGADDVISLPNIAAFVGADLVAGLNCVKMPAKGKYSLLVDLGTNAEVLLFSEDEIFCTAAAAGPCFEGANIAQGMSATAGAICSFSMQDGVPRVKTIEDAPAVGICGTGLADIVAQLLKHGIIDESGYMEEDSFEVAPDVFLEQGDVRQFQLAKSAVCSAITTLLKQKNIRPSDVETLYIAGGFAAKINIENACFVGLLPRSLQQKCVALNNSSLSGAVRFACEQNDLSAIVEKAKYIDLATDPTFSQSFIENMMFEEV